MRKLSSDKVFADFARRGLPWLKIALIALGALLIATSFIGGKDADESTQIGEEERIAELCSSVDGAGECRALIVYEQVGGYYSEQDERISAIAVFCEGADDIRVAAAIKRLLSSMYGIGTNRIEVLGA